MAEPTGATWQPSPNYSSRAATITHIILHNTAGRFGPSVEWLCNPAAQASAHLVIGRSGLVSKLVRFRDKAWHAGSGRWNQCAIGIELEAWAPRQGLSDAQTDKLMEWLRWMMSFYKIPASRVILHRHVVATDCPGYIWPTDADFYAWRDKHLSQFSAQLLLEDETA